MTEEPQASAESMADYYARRALSYERIYHKPERQADLRRLEAMLPGRLEGRRVLEIACGTGWWTAHGATRSASWLATDLNPETMAVARATARVSGFRSVARQCAARAAPKGVHQPVPQAISSTRRPAKGAASAASIERRSAWRSGLKYTRS